MTQPMAVRLAVLKIGSDQTSEGSSHKETVCNSLKCNLHY